MTTPSSSTDVCVDTCVLVNFAIVGRLDLIVQIKEFLFHVPQEVVDEVTVTAQRQLLDEILANGGLKKTEVREVSELARFAEYSQRFGKGESACLAIAACRGWVFATDESKDKRLKKEIEDKIYNELVSKLREEVPGKIKEQLKAEGIEATVTVSIE